MDVCPGLSRVVRKGLRRTYEESRDVVTPAPRCGATNVVLIKIHVYIEDLVQDLFVSVDPRWVAIAETLSGARVPVNETFVLPL